ncbi:MAG: hypothetical protein F4086_16145 [Gemmatimonadetes bacterium]|nr:hypothetical protein [Gemmatimonadota bacterium]
MSAEARPLTPPERARIGDAAAKLTAAIEAGESPPPCPCPDCGRDLFEALIEALDAGAAAAVDQAQASMAEARKLRALRSGS